MVEINNGGELVDDEGVEQFVAEVQGAFPWTIPLFEGLSRKEQLYLTDRILEQEVTDGARAWVASARQLPESFSPESNEFQATITRWEKYTFVQGLANKGKGVGQNLRKQDRPRDTGEGW